MSSEGKERVLYVCNDEEIVTVYQSFLPAQGHIVCIDEENYKVSDVIWEVERGNRFAPSRMFVEVHLKKIR